MEIVKKLSFVFFDLKESKQEVHVIVKTSSNYIINILGLIGIVCCFANFLWLGIICFIIVFVVMNVKSVIFYNIYNLYYKQEYHIEEVGSKYSFKYPRTLVVSRG